MSMVIRSNLDALRTYNLMNSNHSQLEKSLTNVATGMKINSAQDNSSAYAISEKMRVRIRSLDQAYSNTQNASSMIKTAEGAANNILELVKTLKTKAIDSANDSNADEDRQTIQKEFHQLIEQIEDEVLTTFNGMRLIDRSRSNATEAHHTVVNNYDIAENTNSQTTTFAELKNRQGESLGINPEDTIYWSFANLFGSYHGSLKGSNLLQDLASDINNTAGFSAIASFGTRSSYWDRFNNLHDNGGNFAISVLDYDLVTGFTLNVVDSQGNVNKFANRNLKFDDDVTQMEIPTGQLIWQQANCYRALSFQVGSEANQATKFDMGDLRALVIGLTHYSDEITGQDKINISTKEDANLAIDILNKAITKVLRHQTSIGAYLARLEHTASNLTTILTNDQASESTIRDADMAKEMTNYMKNNLLVQSSQAMLAQANQEPLNVMALLNDETAA